MRTASCLTLLAIGAILTFAVTGHPSFLNLQVAGLVIMATGVAGLFLPRRGSGWLRRRTVLRKGTRGPVAGEAGETRYPPSIMLNPGALPSDQPGTFAGHEAGPPTIPEVPGEDLAAERESPVIASAPCLRGRGGVHRDRPTGGLGDSGQVGAGTGGLAGHRAQRDGRPRRGGLDRPAAHIGWPRAD